MYGWCVDGEWVGLVGWRAHSAIARPIGKLSRAKRPRPQSLCAIKAKSPSGPIAQAVRSAAVSAAASAATSLCVRAVGSPLATSSRARKPHPFGSCVLASHHHLSRYHTAGRAHAHSGDVGCGGGGASYAHPPTGPVAHHQRSCSHTAGLSHRHSGGGAGGASTDGVRIGCAGA